MGVWIWGNKKRWKWKKEGIVKYIRNSSFWYIDVKNQGDKESVMVSTPTEQFPSMIIGLFEKGVSHDLHDLLKS